MAFDMITYSPTVPAYLKSVKTVDDVEVGGTLTCDKLIVTDDTRTNEGDLVIQQGDLILYESPAIPDPGERVDERKIVFNLGDSGLEGATCEIGMKGGTNGVQGDIIFRCQTGVEVPGSTLEEVARFRGAAVLFLVGRVEARIADADLVAKDSARRGPPGSPEGREGGSNEFTHTPHGARARDGTGGRPGSPRGLEHRVRSLLEVTVTLAMTE